MNSITGKRPSPALVISMIALFVALAGSAYAAVGKNTVSTNQVKNNSLKSVDIKDKELKGADVKDNSLKGADVDESSLTLPTQTATGTAGGDLTGTYPNPLVGPDTIGSGEIQADSLTAGDLAPNSSAQSELATDSVNSAELVASAVNAAEIGDNFHEHTASGNAVDVTALDGDWHETSLITASCAAGEELVGVASTWTSGGDELATQQLNPNFTAESVGGIGISDDGGTAAFQVSAICMS